MGKRGINGLIRFIFILLAVGGFSQQGFAESNKKFYFGLGGGLELYTGGSNFAEGLMLGSRMSTIGGSLYLITGTKGGARLSMIGAQMDIWPGSGNGLYLGPRLQESTVSGGSLSLSWVEYGGGLGINIPMGASVSFGVDGSYVTGKIAGSTTTHETALVMLKFWN